MLIGDHPAADLWIEKWRHSELPLGAPAECLLERDNVLPEMGKIRCPVLLARGSADGSLPEERMLAIADQLPGDTRLEVIQGAGHSPPMTHPAEVNALLERFLAGVPVAGAARRPA